MSSFSLFNLLVGAICAGAMGSIPFSFLIPKLFKGIDLRQHGSGNVGATNVARTLGARWGLLALACDVAKGVIPVAVLPPLIAVPEVSTVHEQVVFAIFAVLGHMFTPWLGFRGGKGVATALGAVSVMAPLATVASALTFAIVFLVSRIVSLSSIVAALAFAVAQVVMHRSALWTPDSWGLGVFSIGVPLLILLRHRSNIARLWKGEEKSLHLGDSEPAEHSPGPPAAS